MNKKLRPDVIDDADRMMSRKTGRSVTDDKYERSGLVAEKSVPKKEKRRRRNMY